MNFFKKIIEKVIGKKGEKKEKAQPNFQTAIKEEAVKKEEPKETTQAKEEKKEKSEEEIIEELNNLAPGIFAQAKTPEMKKMIIDIYKNMLADGVDVKNEKAVEKWMKENAHRFQMSTPKVETYKREKPKVGRNDPCPCGSGKKYKRCCGSKE